MIKHFRAGLRSIAGLAAIPVLGALSALQNFVVGPLTGNYRVIPNLMYGGLRKLFGYKIEFNAASAPIPKGKSIWFVVNHLSGADAFVVGGALSGSFVGRDDIERLPLLSQVAKSIRFIGIKRSRDPKFSDSARGKIARNFNEGNNAIMFPEGSTSDGSIVRMFHAGLLTLLYGAKATDKRGRPVALNKDVVVQPIAIRVKSVGGKDAIGNADLRNLYSLPNHKNTLKRIWKRAQTRNMTLELTVLPALSPKDYKDAKELANKAAQDIADIVNPGQTTFEKAVIPGYNTAPKKAA